MRKLDFSTLDMVDKNTLLDVVKMMNGISMLDVSNTMVDLQFLCNVATVLPNLGVLLATSIGWMPNDEDVEDVVLRSSSLVHFAMEEYQGSVTRFRLAVS